MDIFALVAVALFIIEGILEGIKQVLPESWRVRIPWPLFSIILAFAAGWALDIRILTAIGLPINAWAEYVIFAITAGKGSGWLHDLIVLTRKEKDAVPVSTVLIGTEDKLN